MNKEEILAASKNEYKDKDLQELELSKKATVWAGCVALILTSVFYGAEIMIKGSKNYGMYAIFTAFIGTMFMYEGVKTKRKVALVSGVIWLILAVALSVIYMKQLVDTSTIL